MKAIFALFCIGAGLAAAQSTPGDPAKGKQLFERNGCYQCHGHEGQGGLAGARLSQTKLSQAGFLAYVRNPRSGMMPSFRAKVLSDQNLADVYAYIKTFPEPRPAKDIPQLNP
jgi:ubiquinol-cytochrome c reductase cytochrome c subunit